MQINIDIESLVQDSITKALNPERIGALVEKCVRDSVDSALNETLRSYSPFGKRLKESIEAAVPHELDKGSFSTFHDCVNKVLSEKLTGYLEEKALREVGQTIDQLLEKPPESITLSALVAVMMEEWSGDAEPGKAPTVIVDSSGSLGWKNIYFDPKSRTSKYSCRLEIRTKDDGKTWSMSSQDLGSRKAWFYGAQFEFSRYCFWLYTGKTKLIIDETDFSDLEWPGEDD